MPVFDTTYFAGELVRPLRERLAQVHDPLVADRVDLLERDLALTLREIQTTTSPGALASLQSDLAKVLPARRDALLAVLTGHLASDEKATVSAVLEWIIRIGVAAGKAFLRA